MSKLKPYMAYACDPSEGAILVFARNVQEAKRVSWRAVIDLFWTEYTQVRVRAIKKWDESYAYLMSLCKKDKPHLIDNPPACKVEGCTYWADGFDGLCEEHREMEQNND